MISFSQPISWSRVVLPTWLLATTPGWSGLSLTLEGAANQIKIQIFVAFFNMHARCRRLSLHQS
jgi:hypothetical protein